MDVGFGLLLTASPKLAYQLHVIIWTHSHSALVCEKVFHNVMNSDYISVNGVCRKQCCSVDSSTVAEDVTSSLYMYLTPNLCISFVTVISLYFSLLDAQLVYFICDGSLFVFQLCPRWLVPSQGAGYGFHPTSWRNVFCHLTFGPARRAVRRLPCRRSAAFLHRVHALLGAGYLHFPSRIANDHWTIPRRQVH